MREVSINVGIGDVITAKSYILDYVVGKPNGKVTISPTHNHLHLRGPGYLDFIVEFMKLVFHEPCFDVIRGNHTPSVHWADFGRNRHRQHKVDLSSILPLPCTVPEGLYTCVNTKVRQYSHRRFLDIKKSFLGALGRMPGKIVVMGEKAVERNDEYASLGDDTVYSIYNYIMELPADKLVDLTVAGLGLTTPNLDTIRKDCYIMSKSRAVINIGYGGNLALSGSVANNINLIGPNQIYEGMNVVSVIDGMFGTRSRSYVDEGAFLTYLS